MTVDANWDVSKPIDHTLWGDVPAEIRGVKSSAKIIIAKEHVAPTTSQAGGQHLQGSARVYLQSGFASLTPDGTGLSTSLTSDNGRLGVDTSQGNLLKVYVAATTGVSTSWVYVTVGGLAAATDVDAGSRLVKNVASGTQSGQAIHIGQLDTTYTRIYEPATSAMLQPNTAAIQQCLVAATSVDSIGSTIHSGHVYKASGDGELYSVLVVGSAESRWIKCGLNTTPTTVVCQVYNASISDDHTYTISRLVRKDEYVSMGDTVTTGYWKAFGTHLLVRQ